MTKKWQNGGQIGKYSNYWDGTWPGIFDKTAYENSFSSSPHNREGGNYGYGTVTAIPAGWYGPFPNTSNSTNSQSSPGFCNIWYKRTIAGTTTTRAELTAAGLPTGATGQVSGIRIQVTNSPATNPPNWAMAMAHVPGGATNTNPTLSGNRTGFTTVINQATQSWFVGSKQIWFNSTFSYNGIDAIGLIWAWGAVGSYNQSGRTTTYTTGTMFYNWTDSSGTYVVTNSATGQQSYRPVFELYFNGFA